MKETEDDIEEMKKLKKWIRSNIDKYCTTQSNQQIQCHPYQNNHDIFPPN